MTNTELRLEAIGAALSVNSPCARPYDRVGDLIKDAQSIFAFIKEGKIQVPSQSLPKTEEL
jgi:hypothetical protein